MDITSHMVDQVIMIASAPHLIMVVSSSHRDDVSTSAQLSSSHRDGAITSSHLIMMTSSPHPTMTMPSYHLISLCRPRPVPVAARCPGGGRGAVRLRRGLRAPLGGHRRHRGATRGRESHPDAGLYSLCGELQMEYAGGAGMTSMSFTPTPSSPLMVMPLPCLASSHGGVARSLSRSSPTPPASPPSPWRSPTACAPRRPRAAKPSLAAPERPGSVSGDLDGSTY